ncbi:hypothetical protein A3L11_09825 [Thermococcus siculi]|uniref:Uncharacterized protein n=1 Tax=Thermococcus siculi TaxID=72803 RepID=A0A2Z2MMA4_9EURY|nr:hypothetical protein [Thermococcus siculi]ASJ09512.1 hypothetical protein A3L11_09825 [Thermococcus siculi]
MAPTWGNGFARGASEMLSATVFGMVYSILGDAAGTMPSPFRRMIVLFIYILTLVGISQAFETISKSDYWNYGYLAGYIFGVFFVAYLLLLNSLIPDWMTLLEATILLILFALRLSVKEKEPDWW